MEQVGSGRERREWNDLASVDPYWAILTHPEQKHGGWNPSAFFTSGNEQVDAMLEIGSSLGVPKHRDTAVDFGCGLGRLTRAVALRFGHVYGIDVSPPLIARAAELNASVPNCEFRLNSEENLASFADRSIDFVCSLVVLQHLARREAIQTYIAEFARILRPGGLAAFQVPTYIQPLRRIQPRRRLYAGLRSLGVQPPFLYRRLGLDPIRMTYLPRDEVVRAVERAGAEVLTAREDQLAGAFPSLTYYITPRSD